LSTVEVSDTEFIVSNKIDLGIYRLGRNMSSILYVKNFDSDRTWLFQGSNDPEPVRLFSSSSLADEIRDFAEYLAAIDENTTKDFYLQILSRTDLSSVGSSTADVQVLVAEENLPNITAGFGFIAKCVVSGSQDTETFPKLAFDLMKSIEEQVSTMSDEIEIVYI
jgi:hypothetical protein